MSPTSAKRIEVPPGAAGVQVVTAAVEQMLTSGSPPLALVPAPAPGTRPAHVAAMSAAVESGAPVPDSDVAVIVPTSGSTGEPHGVMLSRAGLLASARVGAEELGPPGIWLTAVPVTGIGGLLTVVRALLAGHEPVAWPGVGGAASFRSDSFGRSAELTLARADSEGIPAYVSLVPTQLTRLVDDPSVLATLARFGAVVVGGAALSPRVSEAAEAAGLRVVTTYGATETGGGVIWDGRPLPGVEVRINDDGVICIGGPTLAVGYRLRQDLDARRFVDGWYVTGDLGEWEGDRLRVLGRTDSIIKVGGVKVSLTAVTEALLCHPRVIDALSVAHPDAEWGLVPHSWVIPDEPPSPDSPDYLELVAELRDAVADRLGRAATPRELILTDELPHLDSGKPGQAPVDPCGPAGDR